MSDRNKETTGRLITLTFLGIIAAVLSLFAAPAIHLGMTQQLLGPSQLLNVGANLMALFSSKQGTLVFLGVVVVLFAFVLVVVFIGGASNAMAPELRSVTDKIKTPVPAGQKQHGSADWLPCEIYGKTFGIAVIDPKQAAIREYMKRGADDLGFAKIHDAGGATHDTGSS